MKDEKEMLQITLKGLAALHTSILSHCCRGPSGLVQEHRVLTLWCLHQESCSRP